MSKYWYIDYFILDFQNKHRIQGEHEERIYMIKTHTKRPYLNHVLCFPKLVFYSYFFFLDSIRNEAYNFEAILHLCGWVSHKPLIKCRREQYSMNLLCINLMTRIKLAGSILKPCLTRNASAAWDSLHFSAWLIKVCSYLLKL